MVMDNTGLPAGDDRRPVPDPTILTTQQLLREMGSLNSLFTARLEAMDKAIVLTNTNLLQQLVHLRELMDEKFVSVEKQFEERDTRVRETATATKVAVDAALQAAEKAVDKSNEAFALSVAKSEAATMKQLDQLSQLFQTTTDSLKDRINETASRLDRLEGRGAGFSSSWGIAVAVFGMVIGAAGLILSIVR